MDSVDPPVMDIQGSLGDLLLPGIKALQIALVVPNKPAATHTHTGLDSTPRKLRDRIYKLCICC